MLQNVSSVELASLPIPLPGIGIAYSATADELVKLTDSSLHTQRSWGINCKSREILSDFSITKIGLMEITSGRTKPIALEYRTGERITVEMCCAGHSRFREGSTELHTEAGDILAFPNSGGILCGGYHSGISFTLDKKRITQTSLAMLGKDILPALETPKTISNKSSGNRCKETSLIFSLFDYIDLAAREGPLTSEMLGLDDQVYRSLVLAIAKDAYGEKISKWFRQAGIKDKALDTLIDFIRANIEQPITLTELEEQSHYSARHLHTLFHKKFACSPMQFVRRQRLSMAMQRLQTAQWDDSVSAVARDCGYRFVSNFSHDFHKEFGITPSTIIRSSVNRKPINR